MKQKINTRRYVRGLLNETTKKEAISVPRHNSVNMEHLTTLGVKLNLEENHIEKSDRANTYKKLIGLLTEAIKTTRNREELDKMNTYLNKMRDSLRKEVKKING